MALEIDKVREIAERVAASSGLEVLDVEMRGGGNSRRLRIVIDRTAVGGAQAAEAHAGLTDQYGGVTHEDCANLSREVGTILDVEEVVPGGSYVLEVSSPGLDRKLVRPGDYERFTGSLVKLTTRQPVNGNRHFEGRLRRFSGGRLTLELGAVQKKQKDGSQPAQKLDIELANVEKANLVPEI
ncbi:MAG TPA: ribosome maturation factor RimP [Terriglobales bacterium]|nr:ribosome maturation factor RimP [Terriglobales bacterium]